MFNVVLHYVTIILYYQRNNKCKTQNIKPKQLHHTHIILKHHLVALFRIIIISCFWQKEIGAYSGLTRVSELWCNGGRLCVKSM
jgi:hypothetical protein